MELTKKEIKQTTGISPTIISNPKVNLLRSLIHYFYFFLTTSVGGCLSSLLPFVVNLIYVVWFSL